MRRTDAQQGFSSAAADADVIVVGCGLAGLSAALAAAQRRARVVLFDSSSDLFATNDVADRLYFNAVDPERQGDLGITDSPELFYRQTLAAGGGRADPALVKILCYQAYIALKWLEGFGVGFENKVRQIPGGVYPRTCVASDYRAGRLAMMNAALDAGVTVLQGLTFRELVLDAQGRVTGVAAEDADGRRRILRAPATVLATGGFASDAALCARHDRRLGALFDMRGGRASGLGLRAAVKAGAHPLGPAYVPSRLPRWHGLLFAHHGHGRPRGFCGVSLPSAALHPRRRLGRTRGQRAGQGGRRRGAPRCAGERAVASFFS